MAARPNPKAQPTCTDGLSAKEPNSGTSNGNSGTPSSKLVAALVGTTRPVGTITSALGSATDELASEIGFATAVPFALGNDFFGGPTTTPEKQPLLPTWEAQQLMRSHWMK